MHKTIQVSVRQSIRVDPYYPNWSVSDLRADLIDKARKMAITRKQLFDKQRHPWADMDNEELLRTSGLILTDEEGRTGITLAAILLFGTDNMIASACAHHKTDCIYRVYNVLILPTCKMLSNPYYVSVLRAKLYF